MLLERLLPLRSPDRLNEDVSVIRYIIFVEWIQRRGDDLVGDLRPIGTQHVEPDLRVSKFGVALCLFTHEGEKVVICHCFFPYYAVLRGLRDSGSADESSR